MDNGESEGVLIVKDPREIMKFVQGRKVTAISGNEYADLIIFDNYVALWPTAVPGSKESCRACGSPFRLHGTFFAQVPPVE